MITLKDLAKELQLSVSTVSKALNDSYEISDATKKKVKALAKKNNYKRNKAAVSLRKSKTKTIGVIIPNVLNPFFARLLHNVEKRASKYDYNIITCISGELLSKEKKSLELLTDGSVDGILIAVAKETQTSHKIAHLQEVIDNKIPMVMFDRFINDIACDKIITDDYKAVYDATNYLLREGRKRIVLLNSLKGLNVGKLRVNGYIDAIKQAAICKQEPIVFDVVKDDDIAISLTSFFENEPDVDGIIAIDNTLGEVSINVLKDKGKKIPEEVSIIGFSSKHIIVLTSPQLSTIAQQSRKIAKASIRTIINRIEKNQGEAPKTIVVKSKLEHRGTTKEN